jgi:hypothetical protein
MAAFRWWALVVAAAAAATAAGGDMNADRTECADQLVGLAPCLQYVQGQARAPPPDCCGGLRQVLAKSPKCLCVLVKDKDDPNLGIKINATLALALPSACGATRANASHCARKPPLLTRSCMAEQLATEMQSWFHGWQQQATANNLEVNLPCVCFLLQSSCIFLRDRKTPPSSAPAATRAPLPPQVSPTVLRYCRHCSLLLHSSSHDVFGG